MQVRLAVPTFPLALLLAATVAGAQPATTFGELPLRLNTDDSVRVIGADGATTRGTIVGISPATLEVRVNGDIRTFTPDSVREVAVRGDSLRNGTLIGLGAGAAYGVAFARAFSDHPRPGEAVTGALIFGGIGAGIGVGIDALIRGHRVVYRRPGLARVLPVVGPQGRFGAVVHMRW